MDREFLEDIGLDEEKIGLILEKSRAEEEKQRLMTTVRNEMTKRGVKSLDAALKLFDIDGAESEEALSEKIDGFASENEFLFEKAEHKPIFSVSVGVKRSGVTREEFEKMGYIQRLKLFNENPERYRQLAE